MKAKQIYTLIVSIALIIFAIYSNDHEISSPKEQVSGAERIKVEYDKTIKTEYGKPIKVVEVIDGDTLVLVNGEELRYIGVDTPEKFDPRKPVQCFAQEATERNRQLVEGKIVTFEKDITKYDRYGRWLGYVYLEDGTFLNLQLINEGYAFAYRYPPDVAYSELFASAEKYARENKLGLWAGCDVNTLSTGRKQTNPVSN